MRGVHFQYNWWKYLLITMAAGLIWGGIFDALSAPKKNEQLRITCVGDEFLCDSLEKALVEKLPELTEQKIKKISVESPINGQSQDYHSVMATRAYGADIIIVEESAMAADFGKSYFVSLPQLPEDLGELVYYTEDGLNYGILLYDGAADNVFSQFYRGGERCYVFITHNCVNAGGLMGKGKESDDGALRTLAYLLEGI